MSTAVHQKARWAVVAMFFINGALFANWVSRIPQIQAELNLSEGGLGIVLLGLAVGVLTALSLVGGLIMRFGSRRVTLMGAITLCALLPLLALMPNPVLLWLNLFVFGCAMSTMDVAMNAQAVDVERLFKKPLMSSFHAAFSIGGFAGAAMGALMASQSLAPFPHFLIASGAFLVLALLTGSLLLPAPPRKQTGEREPVFQLPPRILWPLGIVAFCAAIGEGAMADWSGVYLSTIVGTDAGTAAFGFAAFSLTMTIGRLLGDRLAARFSPDGIVRAGGLLAAAGLLLVVLMPQVGTTLIGFAAVGAGLSIAVPLAFSAAGNVPGIPAGTGIAGVATIGYAGFLAGPPVIGLIAELTSLRVALLLIMIMVGSLALTAGAVRTAGKQSVTAPVAVE